MRRKWIGAVLVAVACSMGAAMVVAQDAGDGQAAVVPASEQPTDAQLAKLFDVMRVKQQLTATTKMLPQVMQEQLRQQFLEMEKDHPEMRPTDDKQQQALAGIMSKYMGKAMDLYSADEMLTDMGAIYKKHLTGADVEAVTAFYGSPAGQHMLDMNAAVRTEFMPAVMQKMQARMRPLVLEMTQEMAGALKAPAAKPEQK